MLQGASTNMLLNVQCFGQDLRFWAVFLTIISSYANGKYKTKSRTALPISVVSELTMNLLLPQGWIATGRHEKAVVLDILAPRCFRDPARVVQPWESGGLRKCKVRNKGGPERVVSRSCNAAFTGCSGRRTRCQAERCNRFSWCACALSARSLQCLLSPDPRLMCCGVRLVCFYVYLDQSSSTRKKGFRAKMDMARAAGDVPASGRRRQSRSGCGGRSTRLVIPSFLRRVSRQLRCGGSAGGRSVSHGCAGRGQLYATAGLGGHVSEY
ncbi:hypothetical protein EVAR_56981_1 [Eumeta japonica]|uniref:Uncharacterized protein n=1 Tax=Eumeta variegata TaxID=151549 RepID=A0A4C1Z6R7_EUMVA|nr:hypothetical protein EVAR_56981_1 [Eumeta japonica]